MVARVTGWGKGRDIVSANALNQARFVRIQCFQDSLKVYAGSKKDTESYFGLQSHRRLAREFNPESESGANPVYLMR